MYVERYSSESKRQNIENGLNPKIQTEKVRDSIYNIPNRLENVTKRISQSQQITSRNKELIWKFCDYCKLQGLSTLRVLFYLNRFWNIGRLADRDFDMMTKEDLQRLVIAVRDLKKKNGEPISERTIVHHLTAIKTFWKWLKGAENEFPSEVKWIKAKFSGTRLEASRGAAER